MQKRIEKLEVLMDHVFKNKRFPELALTHPSYNSECSYERLEFLGDLVLDAIVGIHLFKQHPKAAESFLTDLKSAYVNSKYLHEVGVDMGIHKLIRYKNYEIPKLDNFIEAIIGAIFLDRGWRRAEIFIKTFILNRKREPIRNHKNILFAAAKKNFGIEPVYTLVSEKGPAHKKRFAVKVKIPKKRPVGNGKGSSKKDAEMLAAADLLQKLEKYKK